MSALAVFSADDFPPNRPGYGLPDGWGVYAVGPGEKRPISLPLDRRCEAAIVTENVVCRCLIRRGHEGLHVIHP